MIAGDFMSRHPKKSRRQPNSQLNLPLASEPVRQGYDQLGLSAFYQTHSADYRNPHEKILQMLLSKWLQSANLSPSARFLDLACGSGEVTCVLQQKGFRHITGIDPFTAEAYKTRTNLVAHGYSFESIANGALLDNQPVFAFDVIVCSFAMHLCAPSRLPLLCMQLSRISTLMVILTPHKRPEIDEAWGWKKLDEQLFERVRLRSYQSTGIFDKAELIG